MSSTLSGPDTAIPRTGLVRVGLGLLTGTVAYILPFSAATSVLLPDRVAALDPTHKVGLLALLTALAAVAALLGNVVFGALSDLTRSRFGARTPWIVAGAIVSALLMLAASAATSFAGLLVMWCLAAGLLNAPAAALAAIVPDRVPVARRATISAVVGVGLLLGTALGTVLGSLFLHDARRGLQVVAAVFVVLAVLAVVIAPDRPSTGTATGRPDARALLGSFRLPRRAPDFYWALWGRLLLVLGYFMINGYQLYIFTDYIGLGQDATARALALNSILFLVTALAGAAIAGPASDRLGRRKIFVVTACLLALLAIAVPIVFPGVGGMIGFALVGGVAFGIYYAVDTALMSEVLPGSGSRARDLGILNIANTGGQVLAPVASSLLVGLGAGFLPAFLGAMLACAVGAALIAPIKSVR